MAHGHSHAMESGNPSVIASDRSASKDSTNAHAANASVAKSYVDRQRRVYARQRLRACDLGRILDAKEAEVVTLDRLAEAVLNRLLALRSRFGLPP
jgi:hypothetical protein